MAQYAQDFGGIPNALSANLTLRAAVAKLAANEAMPGKVTEGSNRLATFREILADVIQGHLSVTDAYRRVEELLPRSQSPHAHNNRVFAHGWGERLVRTQLSRCYNQAVMEELLAEGHTQCYVPHSNGEDPTTPCSRELAGRVHDLRTLHDRLVASYRDANWSTDLKIPNHPHCTHTVTPAP